MHEPAFRPAHQQLFRLREKFGQQDPMALMNELNEGLDAQTVVKVHRERVVGVPERRPAGKSADRAEFLCGLEACLN